MDYESIEVIRFRPYLDMKVKLKSNADVII